MRSLSEPFIRRPVMTVLLTLAVILFGVLAYRALPVNDLPSVDYPVIQVDANYPGATPETMAANVATPLERQFMQIPGLEVVTSKSGQGHTSFVLQFNLNKSIDAAATDVQTAITQATGQLPADLPSPPTFRKTNPNDQPIMYVAMTSDAVPAGTLYDYANTQVRQRISVLPGVSNVAIYGSPSAVRIKADPSAMASRGLSVDDLAEAIRKGTSYQGAGQLDGAHRTYLLQPKGQLDDAAGYNNLIVGYNVVTKAPIFLRDVATASNGLQDERIRMRFWVRDRNLPRAAIVLAIFRQAGSNAVEVAKGIRDVAPQITAELPPSVKLTPIYDRSQSIVNSVKDVKDTLIIAFVLVVVVIFLFLGRAADTLIPAVALPLSLLLTFIVMQMLNYSLDNLSLMALTLAIGFLVDDAIVFLENTVRRMEHGEKAMEAAINSSKEISFTIFAMTISLAAVFIPLVFMSGLLGRIFREFSITIIVAIFASGLVSLTLTPLMCARMLANRGPGHKKTIVERIASAIEGRFLKIYGRVLYFFLDYKLVSLLIWLACLAGTIRLLYVMPKSFLPTGDSSFIMGVMIAQEGSSPKQMYAFQDSAEAAMQANPNVDMTFSATGVTGFLPSNMGFMLAVLKDPKDRKEEEVQFPGMPKPFKIKPPIDMVAGQMMGGVMGTTPGAMAFLQPQPVLQISTGATATQQGQYSYAISGLDPKEVYENAGKLMGQFFGQQGKLFSTVSSDMFLHTPAIQIDILREQAATYNVSPNRIEALLRNAYSQNYVYLIKRSNDQYQVILEVQDQDRRDPQDLSQLYVRSDDGSRIVPLNAVAKWTPVLGPQSVNHLNTFTSVTFSFNLMPGVSIGNATDFIEKSAKATLPPTIRGEFQGETLTFRGAVNELLILGILAVFVMYVVLGILYESYLHPITVLSSLPVALLGGLATLYLCHRYLMMPVDISLYAIVGMFMLMGIVKKNGIMIVDFALARVAQGEEAEKAIHDASMDRFRPIIMTTLAAVMGAIPIAFPMFFPFSSDTSRMPLGLVIVGGLLFSQLITLFITPAIYLYLEEFQEKVLDRTSFFRSSRAHLPSDAPPKRSPVLAGAGVNGEE